MEQVYLELKKKQKEQQQQKSSGSDGDSDEEVYIQFDGWYQSYAGSEFEEYFEVTPEVRPTTYYNRVQK
jgi:hypothetical protein